LNEIKIIEWRSNLKVLPQREDNDMAWKCEENGN